MNASFILLAFPHLLFLQNQAPSIAAQPRALAQSRKTPAPLPKALSFRPLGAEVTRNVLSEISDVLEKEAFAPGIDFKVWPKIAEIYRPKLQSAPTSEDVAELLSEALASFRSSHLTVYSPEFMRAPFTLKGSGVWTMTDPKGKQTIWRVFPDSAAEKAGVRPGDVVLAETNLLSGLDGKLAKRATLKVLRGKQELDFELVPDTYTLFPRASLDWINAETAVLNVPTFTPSYDPNRIQRLMKEGQFAKFLIVDLRFNGGGKPWNVEHLLGFFIPDKTPIGTFYGRPELPGPLDSQTTTDKPFTMFARSAQPAFKGQVAVLLNGLSGSGSEIFAQALREVKRAPILGEPSSGAVLMSSSRTLTGGYVLVFPSFDYVSAGGKRIENRPIQPDRRVETGDIGWPGHPDKGLYAAADWLDRKFNGKTPNK